MLDFLRKVGMKRVLVTYSGQSSLINRLDTDFPLAFEPDMRITARDVVHGKVGSRPVSYGDEKGGSHPRAVYCH